MKPEKKLGLPSLPSSAARPARSMSVTSEEAGSEASIPPGAYIKIGNFEILNLQLLFQCPSPFAAPTPSSVPSQMSAKPELGGGGGAVQGQGPDFTQVDIQP